jgi:hypothetical protein
MNIIAICMDIQVFSKSLSTLVINTKQYLITHMGHLHIEDYILDCVVFLEPFRAV